MRAPDLGSRPSGRRSPATSARPSMPPRPLTTCVARLPRTGGTAIPPSHAMYARVPARRSPKRSTAPAAHARGVLSGSGAPSIDALRSAPATATTVGWSKRSSGPVSVASSAAASRAFPTSALARRCEIASIGPATGTPRSCCPQRPVSWIVVKRPGRRTVMNRWTERDPGSGIRDPISVGLRTPGSRIPDPGSRRRPQTSRDRPARRSTPAPSTDRTPAATSARSAAIRPETGADRCPSAGRRCRRFRPGTRVRGVAFLGAAIASSTVPM